MQGFWWMIIGISAALFVLITGIVLPKLFFKESIGMPVFRDRGIKSYKEKNGRSVVFCPAEEFTKYISQYIISDRNGKKVIICSVRDDIGYIDYNLTLFNASDKPFSVICIKETIEKTGYTKPRELPQETSYVSLTVNAADNIKIAASTKPLQKVRKSPLLQKIALYALICLPLSVLEIFLINVAFAKLFGDVFSELYTASSKTVLTTLGLGLGLAAVTVAISVFSISIMSKKKERKNEL